jgi:hypothetical protein
MATLCTEKQQAAQAVRDAATSLNEAIRAAVRLGLDVKIDASLYVERIGLPNEPIVRAAVSQSL